MSPTTQFWITITFGVFNTLLSTVLAVAFFSIRQVVNQRNRSEDEAAEELSVIEQRLHDTTTKLIDERLRAVSHEVNNTAQSFIRSLEEIKKRLENGEGEFDHLGDSDHRLELKFENKLDQLKDYIRGNCAGKEDLKDHERNVNSKFDRMGEQVGKLGNQVAVLADRVK